MKPTLAITMGDPAGIGAEIAVKALSRAEVYELCLPVVIGDKEALLDANRFCRTGLELREISEIRDAGGQLGVLDYIDLGFLVKGGWSYKMVSGLCGKASYAYVRRGIELALAGDVLGVVTGPINKEALAVAGIPYTGHTEIFADLTDTRDYGMLLLSDTLRVIHVTTHVSMREACDRITEERVYQTIRLAHEALQALGIEHPRIAVAGLNAHAGENGLFGSEEETSIRPAIAKAAADGYDAEGPIPPDTVFVKAVGGMYDVVVAMYHDQGHIPLKLSGFKLDAKTGRYTAVSGVNCTIGLPIVRTSVDHGTAFGKAGEGRANEESMVDAIKIAVTLAKVKFGFADGIA
ncbi:MAG: 4-hydroxythreonine-4-phosphate dehydrogenase PdxA [Clostridiales bacterium]|nr:4-hydroxythreonine-4-phosphate dehydrogenase PdxA [Clostridiales bacterium]